MNTLLWFCEVVPLCCPRVRFASKRVRPDLIVVGLPHLGKSFNSLTIGLPDMRRRKVSRIDRQETTSRRMRPTMRNLMLAPVKKIMRSAGRLEMDVDIRQTLILLHSVGGSALDCWKTHRRPPFQPMRVTRPEIWPIHSSGVRYPGFLIGWIFCWIE